MDKRRAVGPERSSLEDLEVWQEAVDFADRCLSLAEVLERAHRPRRLVDQFESSAVSPAQNIAEGKGRFSKKEFVQFLYVARGSVFEAVTLLTVFQRRKWITESAFADRRSDALRLARRITALINSVRTGPVRQDQRDTFASEVLAMSHEP